MSHSNQVDKDQITASDICNEPSSAKIHCDNLNNHINVLG